MCPIILLIITDIIQPGLDLQQLWQLVFIVPIIGVTMAVIMVVIMVVVTTVVIIMAAITLSLIMGTGIQLIITTIAGTHPILCPITGLKVIMAPDQQTGLTRLIVRPRGRQIVLRREHPIFHPEAHLTEHPQVHPTVHPQAHLIEAPQERPTVHPQAHLTGPLQQTFLQEDQVVPGVVEVIVEVEVE